jgi:hypothetical protein
MDIRKNLALTSIASFITAAVWIFLRQFTPGSASDLYIGITSQCLALGVGERQVLYGCVLRLQPV